MNIQVRKIRSDNIVQIREGIKSKNKNLTGLKFNKLTAIKRVEDYVSIKGIHIKQWLCQCDCGNFKVAKQGSLIAGNTKSCGCLHKEKARLNGKANKKYNKYDLTGEYGIGYTTKGEEFYFDLEDYNKIKDYCWHTNKKRYVITGSKNNSDKKVFLHNIILTNNNSFLVADHINHNTLDNRKINLRLCTQAQNAKNLSKRINNTSGVTGVTWDKSWGKWRANITVDHVNILLGGFINKEDAIKARKEAEKLYFREYSYDNSMNLNNI